MRDCKRGYPVAGTCVGTLHRQQARSRSGPSVWPQRAPQRAGELAQSLRQDAGDLERGLPPQSRQQDAGDLEGAAQSQQLSAGDLRQGRCVAGESARRALVNSRLMDSKPSKGAHCSALSTGGWSHQQVAGVCPKRRSTAG